MQTLTTPTGNDDGKSVINELMKQLRAIFPAWRNSIRTKEEFAAIKNQFYLGLVENNITTIEQLQVGLAEARKHSSPHWPSVGQFIAWCGGDQRQLTKFESYQERADLFGVSRFLGWHKEDHEDFFTRVDLAELKYQEVADASRAAGR